MESDIPLGSVIARRLLVDVETGSDVVLTVGKPRFIGDGWDWVCPFQIKGIGKTIRAHVHGIDALQTLQLVSTAVLGALESTGRSFTFLGDPYWQGAFPKPILDLGLPALGRHLERLMIVEQGRWVKKRRTAHGSGGYSIRRRARARRR